MQGKTEKDTGTLAFKMIDELIVLKVRGVAKKGGPEAVRHAVEDVTFEGKKIIFQKFIDSEDMYVFNIRITRTIDKGGE